MSNHVPCLILMVMVVLILLAFGGYYLYWHKKESYLASCFHLGGKCREVENCERVHQYHHSVTTCIHKRKVCCMADPQPMKNNEDYRDFLI